MSHRWRASRHTAAPDDMVEVVSGQQTAGCRTGASEYKRLKKEKRQVVGEKRLEQDVRWRLGKVS